MDAPRIVDLLFELGQLKHLPRSGWFRAGVDQPESVAAHNLRAAQLAYLLAVMEDHPDPERVCTMVVFHEIGEARVTDLDHVAQAYTERAEDRAVEDQLAQLGEVGDRLYELWDDCEHQITKAGQIAKDADKLEAAFQAREYVENGHPAAQTWIDTTRGMLETASAKQLIDLVDQTSFTRWWRRALYDEDDHP